MNKNRIKSVLSCNPVTERLITIEFAAKPGNLSVVQVYAPTAESSEDDLERFYENLEQTIRDIPRRNIVIITGDWNAKVGTDAYEHWAGVVGRFGLGRTSERGERPPICRGTRIHASKHTPSS